MHCWRRKGRPWLPTARSAFRPLPWLFKRRKPPPASMHRQKNLLQFQLWTAGTLPARRLSRQGLTRTYGGGSGKTVGASGNARLQRMRQRQERKAVQARTSQRQDAVINNWLKEKKQKEAARRARLRGNRPSQALPHLHLLAHFQHLSGLSHARPAAGAQAPHR